MGALSILVLLVLITGAVSMFLVSFPIIPKASSVSMLATRTVFGHDSSLTTMARARKMKENANGCNQRILENQNGDKELNLEDYRPIDPAPASKASVRPGPIEHGSPLNPYIPRRPPPPPGRPK